MPGPGEDVNSGSRIGVLSGALGGALLALAGHVGLLQKYGTVLPYRDQWKATAVDVLEPWLDGALSWRNFFEPLNDHWPVLTRALSFALVWLNGQWNNLLETSVNALLFAGSVAIFLGMILPALRGWTRPVFALLTGLVLALPITWENTLWGIQSLVYLQIGCSLLYFAAICTARTFSIAWWLGHAAGAALLLTQHSAILAHSAVALLLAWRWWRHDGDRRVISAGLVFALVAVVLFLALFPELESTAALRADSWAVGLDVFLRQLAFPLPHPGWAFFVYLPWLIWISTRLGARRMAAADAFILVVGLWVGAQAAAIGYGRGAATYTFVSRYCDFLALGFLLNAACLVRLSLAFPARQMRVIAGSFALLWLVLPFLSFRWEALHSHAGYNLARRTEENARNLDALRMYFESKDSSLVADFDGRGIYSYPPELLPLLDNPRFRSLLPPETGATEARKDHGRLRWIPAAMLSNPLGFGVIGLGLLSVSSFVVGRRRSRKATEQILTTSWTLRRVPAVLAVVGTVSGAATFAWEDPWVFGRTQRLRNSFFPDSSFTSFTPLQFTRGDDDDHPIMPAAGALETMPSDTRAFGYGTRLPVAPDFRGILHSQSLPITAPVLAVPFTGFPCADGNGLRWRIYNPTTQQETWLSYVGPNPGVSWDVWSSDVSAHVGSEATLYLYDGREDQSGWVGVAQPAQTSAPNFRARWLSALRQERTNGGHAALVGLSCVSLIGAVAAAISARRDRRA